MAEHIRIGDVTPRIQYTGDGAQTQFTYPFPIFRTADMEVYLDAVKQTTGFTVNGAGQSAGSDVTFTTAPANGVVVTLRRRLAIQRTSDFQESGEFRSKVINDELDYLTAALQQVSDEGDRALRLTATDPTVALTLPKKTARANMFLAFDADGNTIASDASGPPGPQGPAGNMDGSNNLSELTNPATARTNLGLGAAAVAAVAAGGSGGLLRADGNGSALTNIVVSDNVARANIVLNAFRIAIVGGLSVQNMVDGVVDEFEDETGVDTGASANEAYDAAGDFYHNAGAGSYTQEYTTDDENHVRGTHWTESLYQSFQVSNTDKIAKVKFKTGTGSTGTVNVRIETDSAGSPSGTLLGAGSKKDGVVLTADASNEVTLDTPTTPATSTTYWIRIQYVSGAATIRAHSAGTYPNGHMSQDTVQSPSKDMNFGVYQQAATLNMMLIPNANVALAQPNEAFIVVWQQDIDSVALNTDLKAWASRDGGTTWTQITLAEEASLGTSGRILTGTASISAQPAGTSMKWKLETLNAKSMKIHGVGLEWS